MTWPWRNGRTRVSARYIGIQPGYLREDALRAAHHPSGVDVIGRLVPWADQMALLVDRAVGQVRAQVPASARHREQLAADVSDGVASGANHRPGRQIGCGSHLVLLAHGFIVHPMPGQPTSMTTGDDQCSRVRPPGRR